MGKTQFAFTLSRTNPVFYVNFVNCPNMQVVYKNFISISNCFIETIQNDLKTLNNSCDAHYLMSVTLIDCILPNSTETCNIFVNQVPLQTIGLLWSLIKCANEYYLAEAEDEQKDWMSYYLSLRLKFKPLSLKIFNRKYRKDSYSFEITVT